MLLPSAIGALCGLVLGRRCGILALVPLHGAALVVVLSALASQSLTAGDAVEGLFVWSICCQGAFLVAARLMATPGRPAARQASRPRLRRAP